MLNKKKLLNRILIGAAILVVILGMILLNVFLPYYSNDDSANVISGREINSLIIFVLIALAVYEMRCAFGLARIPRAFSWLLWLYGVCLGPVFCLTGIQGAVVFALVVFVCALITAIFKNRVDSLMYFAFILIYPGMLLTCFLYIIQAPGTPVDLLHKYFQIDFSSWSGQLNGYGNNVVPINAIGLAFVFAVSSLTDSCAYFVGSLFGKRPLCPKISPKKTVEGAIGGVVGGVVGALIVFLLFDVFSVFGAQYGLTCKALGLSNAQIAIIYVVIGLLGSVATQIGDLLASMVKRYCGIKDYSRILGEQGGIMDRFDGMMLNAALVAIIFMFIL